MLIWLVKGTHKKILFPLQFIHIYLLRSWSSLKYTFPLLYSQTSPPFLYWVCALVTEYAKVSSFHLGTRGLIRSLNWMDDLSSTSNFELLRWSSSSMYSKVLAIGSTDQSFIYLCGYHITENQLLLLLVLSLDGVNSKVKIL